MRKINAILGPLMIILLLIHVVSGGMQLWGMIPGGSVIRSILSWALLTVVAVHAFIGIKLTIDTIIACKRAGTSCFRNNEVFWTGRISGAALIILIVYHVLFFSGSGGDTVRLEGFYAFQLAAHILLALALIIHLCVNIKPLFIALGIANRKFVRDIMIVLAIVVLACATGFIVYYLRCNVFWRYG